MEKQPDNNFMSKILGMSYLIKKEFFRKAIHMMSSFVPFFYYHNRSVVMLGILNLGFLYFISEVLRFNNVKIPIITQMTELASRERDEGKIVLGPITLVIGIFLAFTFFDYRSAVIAVFALSFGDGVASLFGKMIGGPKIPFTSGKTFSGSLGCLTVLLIVFSACGLDLSQAAFLAVFATSVEAFPTGDYDNLLIPVLTGMAAQNWIL